VELAGSNIEPSVTNSMVHDIEDMDAILRQFLDYARDGGEEQPGEHDLNALVEETGQRFAARGHMIKTELGRVPPFAFRRHSIRRALDNLMDNAVRYGKNGVRVETGTRVNTRRGADTVFATVSDRGPGIGSGNPTDFIKPFAREDVARSERGAGLGLTIVDRAVRLHGGRLRLENTNGGGLSAIIELPFRFLDAAKTIIRPATKN
jgi:two-component system osmolarity sensor histidine kinase EnvZ